MEMRRFRLMSNLLACVPVVVVVALVTKLADGRTCGILHQDKKISILG